MPKSYLLTTCLFLIQLCFLKAQPVVFWAENFNNGCTANCIADGYSSANGTWSVTQTGTNGNVANDWFISCSENGEATGACGAGCGNNATLHVGSVPCTLCLVCPNGDCGATYNAGPILLGEDPTTDKRVQSPVINTLGKTGIILNFRYIENGQGANDDATVEYSVDAGLTWLLLSNPAKTAICGSGQGTWTDYTFNLPTTCDNISNLTIGLRWKNNANAGTDPSFAVDDIELSSLPANLPVAIFSASDSVLCETSCIGFTDLSTNTPTSWAWSLPGGQPDTSNLQNPSQVCYLNYGTYPVTLTVSNVSGSGTTTYTSFITVHPRPTQPTITQSNDTLICSPAYSYQWYIGIVAIAGATSQTYVPTQAGQYFCLISDSNNCSSGSNVIVITSVLSFTYIKGVTINYDSNMEEMIISANNPLANSLSQIKLFDANGELIAKFSFKLNSLSDKRISLKNKPKGVYIVGLTVDGKTHSVKIIK